MLHPGNLITASYFNIIYIYMYVCVCIYNDILLVKTVLNATYAEQDVNLLRYSPQYEATQILA